SHPKDFSDELIHCIAKHDKICNQIHLPVQSGSTSVLKLMNRGYSREEYIEKALKIKKLIPDVALTTDIICGFPGETDEDFEQTLSLVQKIRYASAFTFYYSPRKGTAAYDMKDLLPEEARKKRLWNLIEIQKEITKQETAKRIGQIEKVMVDSIEKTGKYNWAGRSDHNRVVVFNSDQELYGKILDVEIESASSWTLFGKKIND
ncbi:radical SAM protein, partial [bacterium]|nr:radical SAM protein [bacterium]